MFQKIKDWANKNWRKLKPKPYMSKGEKAWRYTAMGAIIAALSGSVLFFMLTVYAFATMPNPFSAFQDVNLTESTLIMDREGKVLYAIHGDENRESLDSLDKVSPWLAEATIAIEDDQFYDHFGIDIPAIFKAVLSEVGIGTPRGGSTITQQFARNFLLTLERSYTRKLQEILLSMVIELRFSKDEILLMYLNAIPYGNNSHGIQTAAERYFDKDAADLNLAESAVLASIPNKPTRYSPYGNYKHSTLFFEPTAEYLGDRKIDSEDDLEVDEWIRGLIGKTYDMPDGTKLYLRGRSDLVLERMEELGYITETEKTEALAAIQVLEFKDPSDNMGSAPHFVMWIKSILEEKYGADVVEQGGLKVYTTIDPEMQEAAKAAVENRKEFNKSNYNASNAALVSIHPQTGQILAMVGSADYLDDEIDGQVNMAISPRAPGSSFKPFIYSLAFLNRYSPATVLYDVETDFGNYKPKNYSGTFSGPVSMRYALGHSLNIPAIKAYFLAGQLEKVIPWVKKLGLDSIKSDGDYGPSIALGSAEVTPLELASGYSVFANAGVKVEVSPILKIENSDGEILEQWNEAELQKEEVVDPQVAFLINDVLSDPSVGLGGNIRIDALDNAAKTGTSTNTDGYPNNTWIAAYTPSFVTVVWTGNADGSAMSYSADGYSTSALVWKEYMNSILDKFEPTVWPRPEGIKEIAVSKASGKLPSANTPSDMITTEVFASFAIPTELDDSYQTVKVETISGRLATQYSPEEFVEERSFRNHRSILGDIWPSWQTAIDKWAAALGEETGNAPTEDASDIHNSETASNTPEVTITSPNSLSTADERSVDIEVEIQDEGNGMKEVVYLVDGVVQYHADSGDYSGTIRIPTNADEGAIVEVTAKVYDIYGYSGTSTIQIRVGEEDSDEDDEEDEEEETSAERKDKKKEDGILEALGL